VFAVGTGYVNKFGRKLAPAYRGIECSGDRTYWHAFVWGKYLAVAFLEITMCCARLIYLHPITDRSTVSVYAPLQTLILAFNIAECAAIELQMATHQKLKHADVTSGALLNVGTAVVLTILTLVHGTSTPCTLTEYAFNFHHAPMYTMAYMFWNVKFASIAQDNGTLWHIGHSHLPALFSAYFLGTDYMDLRVALLHTHFSIATIFSGNTVEGGGEGSDEKPSDMKMAIGFGSFYDHLMGPLWMWTTAGAAALCTLLCLQQSFG